jgi:CHAT domain-containing protein
MIEARLAEDDEYRPAMPKGMSRRDTTSRPAHQGGAVWESQRPRAVGVRQADAASEVIVRSVHVAELLSRALIRETAASDEARAIGRSQNAVLLSDLSAAVWSRGRAKDAPGDFVTAFEAAEKSWMLRRSPASGWNRALSLEALHLRKDAITKWSEYLAVETDPGWAGEAQGHVRALQTAEGIRCLDVPQLVAAVSHNAESVTRGLGNCSDRARVHGEENLLADWARAFLAGNHQDAASALSTASEFGAALARMNGEHLLLNSVRAIESASSAGRRVLAEGHLSYATARVAFTQQKMTAAIDGFAAADATLRRKGTEFAARACMYGAMAQYHGGQPATARAQLARCARMPFDSLALSGDIAWGQGLIDAATGNASDALIAYQSALEYFSRAREVDNVAALHTQLAILDMVMGEDREAWRHRERALALNSARELPSRRLQILLLDLGRAASADGHPLAALLIQSRIVDLARARGEADFLVNALQYRAQYFADAGSLAAARRDLDEADANLPRIGESAVRERSAANVRMARAHVIRAADPAAAARFLEATIDDLRRVDSRLLLPDLYLELARCYADLRQFPAGAQAIDGAVREIAFLNAKVGIWTRRRAHLDSLRRVRQGGLEMFREQRAYDRALEFAEQFDEQLRADSVRVADLRLPPDTAIVKYALLDEHLLIWIISGKGVNAYVIDVSSRALRTALDDISEDCRQVDQNYCRRDLAFLYTNLIAPAQSRLPRKIVIVPDDFLAGVPFAALYDESAKRYLVEDHTILVSRCTTCMDSQRPFDAGRVNAASRVLAVGNPFPLNGLLPGLPFAEQEARRVAHQYPSSVLLLQGTATKEQFLSLSTKADIVHYAGHGESNFDNPELSALFLASTDHDDGRLGVEEITKADLRNVRLVVLSACQSNAGRFSAQGVLSLGDAFIRAGAQSVVATLWDTDDRDAERLLSEFHAQLQHGSSIAEALRDAQITMLHSDDGLRSVLTWAAYQVLN